MAWFQDGTRLLASGVGPGEHGEKTGIWIINVLTATPHQIRGNAEAAVPSPDGSLIAFRSSTGEPQIAVIDTSGENVRVLVSAALNENFGTIRWSPDGKRLAFVVHKVGDPNGSVDTVDISTGKRSELTKHEHLRTFTWLPDGRIILTVLTPLQAGAGSLYVLARRGKERQLDIGAGLSVADMSVTADGKRLVVIRANEQSDVYAVSLNHDAFSGEPRRITLDDRDDRPSGWLPDGQTILFDSNRNGTFDVFQERLTSPAAEQLAAGPDQQFGAETTPDGKRVLYWSAADDADKMRLMAIPANGGPASTVLEGSKRAQFHCASAASNTENACVLAVSDKDQVALKALNWHDGTLRDLRQIAVPLSPADSFVWALSRDAGHIAFVSGRAVRLMDITSGESWEIAESNFTGKPNGVAFSSTAAEVFVTTVSTRENVVLLATRTGVRKLWTSNRQIFSPIVSPDGKELLLGVTTAISNAWLVEHY